MFVFFVRWCRVLIVCSLKVITRVISTLEKMTTACALRVRESFNTHFLAVTQWLCACCHGMTITIIVIIIVTVRRILCIVHVSWLCNLIDAIYRSKWNSRQCVLLFCRNCSTVTRIVTCHTGITASFGMNCGWFSFRFYRNVLPHDWMTENTQFLHSL